MDLTEIDDSNYDRFRRDNERVVVDVWAPWCVPCRSVTPIVERLSEKYRGTVAFAKLNSDDNYRTAGKLGIMGVPVLLFYHRGKLVDQLDGAHPSTTIEERVQRLVYGR